MELNLFAFAEKDRVELMSSYNQLANKDQLYLVNETHICDRVLNLIVSRLNLTGQYEISIQNLLSYSKRGMDFYISQTLMDFKYPFKYKGGQASKRVYTFQVIGFTEICVDLGNTILSLESKQDKILERFLLGDVKLKKADSFNNKFKIKTNRKESLEEFLNQELITELMKQDDIILLFDGIKMFVAFENTLRTNQMRVIQNVFECVR